MSVGEKRKLPGNSDTSTGSDIEQEPKVAISLSGTVQKKPIGVTMKLVRYFSAE